MTTVTATDLARNFSAYLNQVRYQGASFEIRRGSEVVARLMPAAPVAGYPLDKLAGLFADLPALPDDDATVFIHDIGTARRQLTTETDAWDS